MPLRFHKSTTFLPFLKFFYGNIYFNKKYKTANFAKKSVIFAILLKLDINMVVFPKMVNHNNHN